MTRIEGDQADSGLDDEQLALIRQTFTAYEDSGDPFERARLVSTLGKTHALRLLNEVERLRGEISRRNHALLPLVELLAEPGTSSHAALERMLADASFRRALRAAITSLGAINRE